MGVISSSSQITELCSSCIFGTPKSKPPVRMERWNRCLQGYDFEAVYTQGSQIPSDYLSHHAMPDKERQRSPVEGYINFLVVPKAMTLKFRNETKPYNAYPD